jgi:hypothetical protein
MLNNLNLRLNRKGSKDTSTVVDKLQKRLEEIEQAKHHFSLSFGLTGSSRSRR